jgi:hypothetical protein
MTRKPTETLLGSWPLRQTSLQVFGRFRRRGIRRHLRQRRRRLHRHPFRRFLLLPAPSWLRWPTTLSALGLVATIFLVQFWMAGGHKIYNSTMVQTITVITDYCHLWSAFCFGNWTQCWNWDLQATLRFNITNGHILLQPSLEPSLPQWLMYSNTSHFITR